MPKRGVVAIVLTTVALVLLLNFKTPDQGQLTRLGGAGGANGGGVAVVQPSQAANAGNGGTGAGADQAGNGAGAGGGAAQGVGSGGQTAQATPTPAGRSARKANGQVTGPVENTPYGPVQVQVTIQGGKITDVQAIQTPSDRFRSQQINAYAAPVLQSEALQAQSAQIDMVSGATWTSEGFIQSLQAALQQAGL